MSTLSLPSSPAGGITINGQVHVPGNLTDLDAFRHWARTATWPDRARFAYLAGLIWAELSMEQAYSHNDVKSEFTSVLRGLARQSGAGRYFSDGMLLSNPGANLSTVPDGLYVLHSTFQSNRVREVAGRVQGVVEFEGTPDMVLEVFSDTSEQKDTLLLPPLYHLAQIPEFWRADARGELRFEVLRWTPGGYVPTQQPDGWWHSDVFDRDFLLTSQPDVRGQPEFTLQVRP